MDTPQNSTPPSDYPDMLEAARRAKSGERATFIYEGVELVVVPAADAERLEAEETRIDLAAVQERQGEPTAPWEEVRARLGL